MDKKHNKKTPPFIQIRALFCPFPRWLFKIDAALKREDAAPGPVLANALKRALTRRRRNGGRPAGSGLQGREGTPNPPPQRRRRRGRARGAGSEDGRKGAKRGAQRPNPCARPQRTAQRAKAPRRDAGKHARSARTAGTPSPGRREGWGYGGWDAPGLFGDQACAPGARRSARMRPVSRGWRTRERGRRQRRSVDARPGTAESVKTPRGVTKKGVYARERLRRKEGKAARAARSEAALKRHPVKVIVRKRQRLGAPAECGQFMPCWFIS